MKPVQVIILLVALILCACTSPAPTSQPSLTPAESSDYHSLDTQTGLPEVDSVLAAVASGDPEQLRALVRFTTAPCTTAGGLGGPPKCAEGVPEGTLFEVLPVLGPEGSYIEKENIGSWPGIDVAGIHAVYRVSENALEEEYSPPGDYLVYFVPTEGQPGVGLRIADGSIVRVDYQFDDFPDSIRSVVERDASEVILAPKDH